MGDKFHSFRSFSEKFGRSKRYDLTCQTIREYDEVQTKENMKSEESYGLGYRHLVAFWCFFYFVVQNSHFAIISITIVAMVNHTQTLKEFHHMNTSIASCPLHEVFENTTSITKEGTFNWDSQLQGYVIGVGSFGYMITNFLGGRVPEKFGAKRTLWLCDMLVVACTIISPFAAGWSVYALIVFLLVKGLVQGFVIPCVFVMMANWFPRNERGLLSSFACCGASVGSAISGIVFGRLCDVSSLAWPSAFYFLGGFNFCMSMIFLFTFYEVPKTHPYISKEELKYIINGQENDMSRKRPPAPWKIFFTSISVYALIIGKVGFYWSIAHFTYMHPTYMGTVLHFSMTKNGMTMLLLFSAQTVGTVISMTTSNWLRKKDFGVDKLRKGCNSISAFGFSICIVGVLLAECDTTTNIVCCTLAMLFGGFGVSGAMIASGDMSPIFSGSLTGISSSMAMLSVSLMPVIVGTLTKNETLGEWRVVFIINIAVIVSFALFFHIFGSADIQPWDSMESPGSANRAKSNARKSDQIKEFQVEDDFT